MAVVLPASMRMAEMGFSEAVDCKISFTRSSGFIGAILTCLSEYDGECLRKVQNQKPWVSTTLMQTSVYITYTDIKIIGTFLSVFFFATLFAIAREQKQPLCPSTDESVIKMWYLYKMILIAFSCNEKLNLLVNS